MDANNYDYRRIHGTAAPESMTMDRLENLDELVVAQTTQLCCRVGCFRPSINWVLLDSSNYELGSTNAGANATGTTNNTPVTASTTNPFELPSVGGWIHEESTFFQRACCTALGSRETRFVHHAGLPPPSLGEEDRLFGCMTRFQTGPASSFLAPGELSQSVVAVHEKGMTCPTNCCCFPSMLPYLKTSDHQGRYLGETRYVCDECIFVPKFAVFLANHPSSEGQQHQDESECQFEYDQPPHGRNPPKYLLRPDTCWNGCCPRPRCGGRQGKCCRLPYLVRDPKTGEPLPVFGLENSSSSTGSTANNTYGSDERPEQHAQVTQLWSGLANELCFKRHAYHLVFPSNSSSSSSSSTSSCPVEDKLVLIGSSILIDVALFENDDDN